MSDHANMEERDVDRLFERRAAVCSDQDAGIESFFADLRASQAEASTEHCEQAHLSAMFREAHLITEKGEPVARPASKAHGPAGQASGLPKWRERVMARFSGLTVGARVAAAATLLVFAFTGVAVAGGLPHPVQHAVSQAVSAVGISIPDPEDAIEIEAPELGDAQDQDHPTEIESDTQDHESVSGEAAKDAQDDQDDQSEASNEKRDGTKADADDADEHDSSDDAEEARSDDDRDEHQAVAPRDSDSSDHESDDSEDSEAGADD